MQPILAHGGGVDELLLVLALAGLPLVALAILARRVRPDDDDEELPVE